MNLEIELKFSPVLAVRAAAVFADPAVAPYLGPEERIRMRTEYFDTPEGSLGTKKYTLRLRRENGVGICTLKGPKRDGGRPEYALEADTLEAGVRGLCRMPGLDGDVRDILSAGAFGVTCSAVFTRTLRRYSREGRQYEISFDEGQLQNGGISAGLSELEIELKGGDTEGMRDLGSHLAQKYGLTEERRSKHQRAMALAAPRTGMEVSPYFIGSELLNFCVKKGYLHFAVGEDKLLHYTLTELGERVLPGEYGVDFSKPCAGPEGASNG